MEVSDMAKHHKPAARKTKYEKIADRYRPRGYTVKYHKGLYGWHDGERKLILAPRPTTPSSLYIFLHECAHASLHMGSGMRSPKHVKEIEADQWARARMAEHGVAVPPDMTERTRKYIAQKIVRAEAGAAPSA